MVARNDSFVFYILSYGMSTDDSWRLFQPKHYKLQTPGAELTCENISISAEPRYQMGKSCSETGEAKLRLYIFYDFLSASGAFYPLLSFPYPIPVFVYRICAALSNDKSLQS